MCTKKKVSIACCCIPLLCLVIYAYLFPNMEAIVVNGYTMCSPKQTQGKQMFKAIMQVWVIAYFFVPAIVIVVLNGCIVWKLKRASDMQSRLTEGRNYSLCNGKLQQESKAMKGVRKATVLVIVASVTFVLLMIPRGVSTTLVMDVSWTYKKKSQTILDWVSYLLQYLNHATNFFIYVLANAAFRRELVKIFLCRKKKQKHTTPSTTMLTTAVTSNSLNSQDGEAEDKA